MVHTATGAPFRVSNAKFRLTKLTWLGAASLAAISVLVAVPDAQARITKIQILTRGTAFGGHSFTGVGQYEYITGIATGEVDPNNSQNSLITDIQLAPKNPQGHVDYSHNFYILQPLDTSKGNHKMMYEPPNRGGKTYQTLNNTPTGTNDPAALTVQLKVMLASAGPSVALTAMVYGLSVWSPLLIVPVISCVVELKLSPLGRPLTV